MSRRLIVQQERSIAPALSRTTATCPTPTVCQCEALEQRWLLAADFRPIDGLANNLANPTWGTGNTAFLRLSPAAYRVRNDVAATDPRFDPNGNFTPSMNGGAPFFVSGSRLVSNVVHDQATTLFGPVDHNTVNGNRLSAFAYVFGQFLDHDMTLTPDDGSAGPNGQFPGVGDFPIPKDATHDTAEEGLDPIASLAMARSNYQAGTGSVEGINPRQQLNANTAYLDLSQVYGSTAAVADALRTFKGGRLKSSPGADGRIGTADDLLPYNNLTYFTAQQIQVLHMFNDTHVLPADQLFAAGDPRANETTDLTAMQTLFLRNHNRLASLLQRSQPGWNDQRLYQEARRLNIAQMQAIVYEQYLPALLGRGAIPSYSGYRPAVDPSIANEFATIGFRFGHSLLNSHIQRHDNQGRDIDDPGGDPRLSETFFNPNLLNPNAALDPISGHATSDIGPVLKGAADVNAQAMDVMAVSEVRNLLFGPPGSGFGEDLMARDLWRAHDHGIGTYNQVRVAYGLPAISSFDQITGDTQVQQRLETAYVTLKPEFAANGKNAGDIDPFAGMLAEDHLSGSELGPLGTAILADQFTRLRDGDRFFYLNTRWSPRDQGLLAAGDTLAELIKINTDVRNLQANVFFFNPVIQGQVFFDANGDGRQQRNEPPLADRTVILENESGQTVKTTTTAANGSYRFEGIELGSYRVRQVLVEAWVETTPPREASLTYSTTVTLNLGTRPAVTALPAASSSKHALGPSTGTELEDSAILLR